jgi:hypothetical protein
MTNTTLPNNFDAQSNGRASSLPFVDEFMPRDPTTSDIQYPIQKKWLNTLSGAFWELQNFNTVSGITTAHWVLIGQSSSVTETLTGNDLVVVPPTGNNINVVGDVTTILTSGNAGTSTLTIKASGALAHIYTEDVGTATPSAGNLNVLGTGGIATTGAGNTITIDGSGVVANNLKFNVDAHTAPGTNPVVPDGTNHVTVTGGQVPAGTTANAIRTDSLAANTFTVEVQRSQASAGSFTANNGVCHFNSTQFQVDSNAFVQFPSIGAFSPTIFGATTAGTATYQEQSGRFQILGNWIVVNINLRWTLHTGTGNMMVGNFPQIFAGAQSFYPSVCMLQNIAFPASTSWIVVDGVNATTTAEVIASIDSGSFTPVQMSAAGSLHSTLIYPYV